MTSLEPFDSVAQQHVAGLFRTCPPDHFVRELRKYQPVGRDEEVSFETYYGWALQDTGEHYEARAHLLRALRRSRPASPGRAILRGLLGQECLRVGELALAERCAQRALSDLPAQGDVNYLRAGNLGLLGRVQYRQGHVVHAIETLRRALLQIDVTSPHWCWISVNLAHSLILRGQLHEADVLLRALRDVVERGECWGQQWMLAHSEVFLALSLGDIDRAEHAVDKALASPEQQDSDRVRLMGLELQAMVLSARGKWQAAEAVLRAILEDCDSTGRNQDLVADVSRALAEALEGQERYEEAIEPARTAAGTGIHWDRLYPAAGFHVLGRCLLACHRTDEARRAFRDAIGLHERAEFDLERARLEKTLTRLGLEDLAARMRVLNGVALQDAGQEEMIRLNLADGRTFLTANRRLVDDLRLAAMGTLPVLIEGETGTGKELVARLLHELGPRSREPFVVVDCATLSAEIAEAELFGAMRGAFTGAYRDRAGLVAHAARGTVFLDELPELSLALQAKLLRVLQEGTYRRVGEDHTRRTGARFIAATNRTVNELLQTGALRPDLFHRLNGHRLTLEALRNRRREIRPLASEFIRRYGLADLTPAAIRALEAFHWPGNVRQLEMVIQRASSSRSREGAALRWEDLGLTEAPRAIPSSSGESLRNSRAAWERSALIQALQASGGVVTRAARSLGITRQGLYLAMQRTGITRENLRNP